MRVAVLEQLSNSVLEVYASSKPSLLTKYVVPLAAKLSTEPKQDIQGANRTLIRALKGAMGDEFNEGMRAHVLSRPL